MSIKIYGDSKATCTQRILTTLLEKGVTDYTLVTIDLMGGAHKRPEYLTKQPFGCIPYLEDGDVIIYESRAICYYIASKYANQGTKLLPDPTDLKATALFQQWSSVEKDNFDVYAVGIVMQKLFGPRRGKTPDPKLVEYYQSSLAEKLQVFNSILAKQEYMGGNEFSLIDIYYYSYTNKLFAAGNGNLITDQFHVKAWWDKISSRDSWKKVLEM